jgi:hypothetical protein
MTRAVVAYKTKDELRAMNASELKAYISFLKRKAEYLNGPARKSVEKRAAVAENVLSHFL